MIENPDYGKLAANIIISNQHKNTSPSFSETIQIMYDNKDIEGKLESSLKMKNCMK